jgi:multidrug efflux pump subunit AcrA (membrane-fusion protein)
MTDMNVRLFPLFGLLLILSACDSSDSENEAGHNEENEPPTNRVEIPATVRSNLGITFAKVERRDVTNTIRVPGSFELEPLARHEYRVVFPGHVEFEVAQFDKVEAGTVLYRFRSPKLLELQAQVDLANATLAQTIAKHAAVMARIKALAEASFKRADLDAQVTELEADMAKQEAEVRVAMIALISATPGAAVEGRGGAPFLATDWLEVLAKEAGVVESLAVTDGAFVEEASLVLTTVDPAKVRFRAMGLQSDFPNFKNGQIVNIVPPQAAKSDLNESIKATLQIGLSADPQHRTVTLFATPEEQSSWSRAGVPAFLEIAEEASDGIVLAIPSSAVVKDGITHVFFKRDPLDANKAIRVEADLGVNDGRWVEIKSDLGPKDEVVLNGVYELKLATAQSGSSQKGGHFHADGSYHGED